MRAATRHHHHRKISPQGNYKTKVSGQHARLISLLDATSMINTVNTEVSFDFGDNSSL